MTNLGTHMYEWLFHYNPYTSRWEAYHKDDYPKRDNIIASSSIHTLIEIIDRTEGDPILLKKLVNGTGN